LKDSGIIPDTCAWIAYFRPGASRLGERLEEAIATRAVYACGPVLTELMQGVRSEKQRTELTNALSALPFLEMTESLWVEAGRLSGSLQKAGKTIPFSDILIATLALENNLAVMTADEHFRSIPGLAIDPAK
jgi:predicted nucleic acid-binding protein